MIDAQAKPMKRTYISPEHHHRLWVLAKKHHRPIGMESEFLIDQAFDVEPEIETALARAVERTVHD
jgi:hypothetical protein